MGYEVSDFSHLTLNFVQRHVIQEIAGQLPLSAQMLEIGVGSGEVSNMLASRGYEVVSVDVTEACLRTITAHNRVYLHDLNTPPLPFADQSFDFVIMFEVVEHLWNPLVALADVRRVLRPDGRLLISTPNVSWLVYRLRYLLGQCPEDFHTTNHVQFWNWDHFEHALHRSRFAIEAAFSELAIPVGIPSGSTSAHWLGWLGLHPACHIGRSYHTVRPGKHRLLGWDMVVLARLDTDEDAG